MLNEIVIKKSLFCFYLYLSLTETGAGRHSDNPTVASVMAAVQSAGLCLLGAYFTDKDPNISLLQYSIVDVLMYTLELWNMAFSFAQLGAFSSRVHPPLLFV